MKKNLLEQTGVIGEKIEIGGFKILEAPFVGSYIHGNKIAALVGLSAKTLIMLLKWQKMFLCKLLRWEPLLYLTKILTPEFVASETEARIAVIEKDNIELGRLGKTLKMFLIISQELN